MFSLEYIQLGVLILGIISLLIAGVQDKKNRLAPAIYLTPTLIGFGLNPILGLVGAIITIGSLFFWKDEWNKKFGLADFLLFTTLVICMANFITLAIILIVSACVVLDLLFLQKKESPKPLVWLFAKWFGLILLAGLLISIIGWFFG